MEPFVSHSPGRRECWKGHADVKGVRQAIWFDQRSTDPGRLQVFAQGTGLRGVLIFVEIPRSQWAARFQV